MSIKIEEIIQPAFTRNLEALELMLKKGEAYALSEGIDLETLVEAKVADSMHSLEWQVQKSTGTVILVLNELSGFNNGLQNVTVQEPKETYRELQNRVRVTSDYFSNYDLTTLSGTENRIVKVDVDGVAIDLTGLNYLMSFGLPNFYFHLAGTFNILRGIGVKINKLDFLGVARSKG